MDCLCQFLFFKETMPIRRKYEDIKLVDDYFDFGRGGIGQWVIVWSAGRFARTLAKYEKWWDRSERRCCSGIFDSSTNSANQIIADLRRERFAL